MNNHQFAASLAGLNIFHPIYETYCIIELLVESQHPVVTTTGIQGYFKAPRCTHFTLRAVTLKPR